MIYLDNAATSWPKPDGVVRVMHEFTRDLAANPGRSAHRMAVESERRIEEARTRLARLLNAPDPSRIVFTLNGTDALNIAVKGVVRTGDHVVISSYEHNSVTRPLARMAKFGRITLTRFDAVPSEFPRARLVATVHVSNVLGRVNRIDALVRAAHAAGALVLIDAAQSAGAVPIDVQALGVDLLAFPGHKGLFGPMGTGALYVRPGLELDFFREGGTGVRSEEETHTEEMPHRLEGGTPNAHGLAALAEGLRFVEERGVAAIGAHERELARAFAGRAPGRVHTPNPEVGLVGVTLPGLSPAEVARRLDERGIAVRAGTHCAPGAHRLLGTLPDGFVRFSFGPFNTHEHVDAAVRALKEIAA